MTTSAKAMQPDVRTERQRRPVGWLHGFSGCRGGTPTVIAHGCAAVALAVGPAKGAGQSWAVTQSADPLYLAHESKNCRSAFSQANSGPNKAALEAAHQ